MSTTPARLIASIALVASPVAAAAQSASGAYVPPQLTQPGQSSKVAAGAGEVDVQVFVKKDGTFEVKRVIKSSNPGDNEVALDQARSARYAPAKRNGSAVDAYYDYIITFKGAGVTTTGPTGSGPTAEAYTLIRNGKYADAKAALSSYLQGHPDDVQANTLLGVANAFGGDDDAAVAAFDNVPSIPEQYRPLATQAYTTHTSALIKAGKYADASSSAGRLIALAPSSPDGYFLRGIAAASNQNFQAALPDLQKSLDLARAAKSDDKSIANIEFNLAVAQLNSGALDDASTTIKDVTRLDPLQSPKLQQAAYVAVNNQAIGLANAGKIADAVAFFERGAQLFPSNAGNFYGQASYVMLTDKSPDFKKAKAESEKALAADPTNGHALLVGALVAGHDGDAKNATALLTRAKASPLYGTDANFAKQVDDDLKKMTASGGS